MSVVLDRRNLLGAGLGAMVASGLPSPARAAALRVESFPLWPGVPPGAPIGGVQDAPVLRSVNGPADDVAWTHVATPLLTVVRPARPDGRAMLLIPGGGYARVALQSGGSEVAHQLAARGITAFDLRYRLPHDGWSAGADVTVHDAMRAMRLIRSQAWRWGVDPAKLAAFGASAGGHCAARLGSQALMAGYAPVDQADTESPLPAFLALYFPVVTLHGELAHAQSARELLGENALAEQRDAYSADHGIPATMPPTYIGCCADDPVVDPGNSLALYAALRAAAIPSELMVFERGGHGFPSPDAAGKPYPWLDLMLKFGARHGW
jgi:acetyl esterase/lipase